METVTEPSRIARFVKLPQVKLKEDKIIYNLLKEAMCIKVAQ